MPSRHAKRTPSTLRSRPTPMHAAVCLALGLSAVAPSWAQTAPAAPAGTLETVTVTADRREENIKDVPVAAFTVSGEKLDILNSGGQDVRFLANRVPSLNIESSFGRAFPRFYIRGYGNTDFRVYASQPVSLVYDDVVQENAILKGFPVFDLDRVEVLAGPQGSLFGRNTPAGVVKFDSAAPVIGDTGGYGILSYGTYDSVTAEAAVAIPINDMWAMRVSGLYQHRDDWVHNRYNAGPTQDTEGYNDGAIRVQALYKPYSNFSALFNVHARDFHGSAREFRANIIKPGGGFVDGFDKNDVYHDGENTQQLHSEGASARLRYDMDQYAVSSITGWEKVNAYSRGDIDGGVGAAFLPSGSFPGVIPFPSETGGPTYGHIQLTQEVRVESKYAGPLNWQAGVYAFYEDFKNDGESYDSFNGGVRTQRLTDEQHSKSYAAFGSLRYDIDSAWNVRGGLRFTKDKKNIDSAPNRGAVDSAGLSAKASDSKVNWDLATTYALTPDLNVYGRIATGYRGSSFQSAGAFGPQSEAGPEDNTSYEVGIKSDFFDKRARVSADVFYYKVDDLQLTAVGGAANANRLLNAKHAAGKGFELSLDAYVLPELLITANGSYNHTELQDKGLAVAGCGNGCQVNNPSAGGGNYFIDGNSLPNAPKWIANLTARYGIHDAAGGEYFVYTDWTYRSKVNFFLYSSPEETGQSLVEGGLKLGYAWHNGDYEAAIFGRNITNKIVITGAIDFNNKTGFINDPRIIGVSFKGKF
ncbi:TonB-dependent receptor [soil metagenome]